MPAKLVGADPIFDLAVIQISKPKRGTLPTVKLGDSDKLRPGEEVIAIGNPLGLDQTVTRGIVSGLNRLLPETPLSLTEPLIQTDTAINPGNSGGPLLNRCGEVIGITTAIVPEAQNIGFAIPINLAKAIIPGLIKDGHVIRPWIGFHGQLIGAELRKLLQMPLVDGLLVEVVEPGSPADKLGVRGGEMELSIGGSSLLLGGDIVVSLNERADERPGEAGRHHARPQGRQPAQVEAVPSGQVPGHRVQAARATAVAGRSSRGGHVQSPAAPGQIRRCSAHPLAGLKRSNGRFDSLSRG